MVAAAGAALAVAATGCGLLPTGPPSRDATGVVIEGGEAAPFDLRRGDCFNNPGEGEVHTVEVVPCQEPHDFEVYHLFTFDDGPYPGDEAIKNRWINDCLAEFEPFVGSSFDESMLDVSAIFPTPQSWEELGDREVLCSVTAVSGEPRTSSARNSGI